MNSLTSIRDRVYAEYIRYGPSLCGASTTQELQEPANGYEVTPLLSNRLGSVNLQALPANLNAALLSDPQPSIFLPPGQHIGDEDDGQRASGGSGARRGCEGVVVRQEDVGGAGASGHGSRGVGRGGGDGRRGRAGGRAVGRSADGGGRAGVEGGVGEGVGTVSSRQPRSIQEYKVNMSETIIRSIISDVVLANEVNRAK